MKRIILKRVSLPDGVDAEEKIRSLAGQVNDLEGALEVIFDAINGRIEKGAD